jgi:hypothetical protein
LPSLIKFLQYYTTSYKLCIVKYQKKQIVFAEKLHDFALPGKTTQVCAIMRDIFLERVGNNGEEQI